MVTFRTVVLIFTHGNVKSSLTGIEITKDILNNAQKSHKTNGKMLANIHCGPQKYLNFKVNSGTFQALNDTQRIYFLNWFSSETKKKKRERVLFSGAQISFGDSLVILRVGKGKSASRESPSDRPLFYVLPGLPSLWDQAEKSGLKTMTRGSGNYTQIPTGDQ